MIVAILLMMMIIIIIVVILNNTKAFQEYIALAPVRRSSNGSLHELPPAADW